MNKKPLFNPGDREPGVTAALVGRLRGRSLPHDSPFLLHANNLRKGLATELSEVGKFWDLPASWVCSMCNVRFPALVVND